MAIFKRACHKIKVLPHPWPLKSQQPLMRVFKWDTIWTCNSSGTENMESQSQNFQIWSFAFPLPLELKAYTASHLKALISGYWDLYVLGRGSTIVYCNALLKIAILLHIEDLVLFVSGSYPAGQGSTLGINCKTYFIHFNYRWLFWQMERNSLLILT